MGFHFLETAYRAGKVIKHAVDGEGHKIASEAVKTVASVVPGGSFVAGKVMDKVIDTAIAEGNMESAAKMGHAAWHNRDSITDIDNSIDAMGNCDGISEASDIIDAAKDFMGL
jgi:hypothetical protein